MNLLICIVGLVTVATAVPFGNDRDIHHTYHHIDHVRPSIKTAKQLIRQPSNYKRKQILGPNRGKNLFETTGEDLEPLESGIENQFVNVLPLESEDRVVPGSINKGRQLEEDLPSKIMPYEFEYNVDDEEYKNYYGHKESASEDTGRVEGEYYNWLPDGRLMRVQYYVDGNSGFVPKITYESDHTPTWGTKLFT